MDVYLTETELLREKNLFEPHEESYAPLEGKPFDISSFTEISDDEDAPVMVIPPSC